MSGSIDNGRDNHGLMNTGTINAETLVVLLQQAEQAGASPKVLKEAYLSQLLHTANRSYFLARSNSQQATTLSPVYTPLMSDLPEPGSSSDKPNADLPRLSAVEALAHHRHMVLLGGPGSGKSSLAHMLAVSMAGEQLGRPNGQPNLSVLLAPVPEHPGGIRRTARLPEERRPQHWPHGPLLPVLVVLREFAAQLPPAGHSVNAETLFAHVQERLDPALKRFGPMLQDELLTHGGLVILDGLDEVPEAQERRAQLRSIIEDFSRLYHRCRILVTSRPLAYQRPEWQLQGFMVGLLQRFHEGQMAHFARAWFAHLHTQGLRSLTQATAGAEHLMAEIRRNPRVRELATEPLLLTLMAKLQTERGGELPAMRHELYNDAVKLLLGDWESYKRNDQDASGETDEPSLSEWLKTDRERMRQGLEQLAFEVHASQALLGEAAEDAPPPCADISGDLLTLTLIKAAGRQDVKSEELKAYLKLRAGLLAEVEDNIFRLPHRSFQEYMAACHLGRSGEFAEELTTLSLAEPNRWREVLRLAAANVRDQPALLWMLVAELLAAHDDPKSQPSRSAWAVLLAGDALAETTLQNTPKRHQRDRDRLPGLMLGLLGNDALPAAQRVQLGRHLDLLGDPRPEVVSLDTIRFALQTPGTYWLGYEQLADRSPEHPHTIGYPFALAEFPLSTAQWREFVQASGHSPEDPQSLTGPGNQPAVCVAWTEARALCAYLNDRWQSWLPSGWHVDLPTEAEWEFGARGAEQIARQPQWITAESLTSLLASASTVSLQPNPWPRRRFPWGDDDIAEGANIGLGLRRSSLGCFPLGASANGLQDMGGNVWEWTRSLWGRDDSKFEFGYPYAAHRAKRERLDAGPEVQRVVRGGSFYDPRGGAHSSLRFKLHPPHCFDFLGLRLVLRSSPV